MIGGNVIYRCKFMLAMPLLRSVIETVSLWHRMFVILHVCSIQMLTIIASIFTKAKHFRTHLKAEILCFFHLVSCINQHSNWKYDKLYYVFLSTCVHCVVIYTCYQHCDWVFLEKGKDMCIHQGILSGHLV